MSKTIHRDLLSKECQCNNWIGHTEAPEIVLKSVHGSEKFHLEKPVAATEVSKDSEPNRVSVLSIETAKISWNIGSKLNYKISTIRTLKETQFQNVHHLGVLFVVLRFVFLVSSLVITAWLLKESVIRVLTVRRFVVQLTTGNSGVGSDPLADAHIGFAFACWSNISGASFRRYQAPPAVHSHVLWTSHWPHWKRAWEKGGTASACICRDGNCWWITYPLPIHREVLTITTLNHLGPWFCPPDFHVLHHFEVCYRAQIQLRQNLASLSISTTTFPRFLSPMFDIHTILACSMVTHRPNLLSSISGVYASKASYSAADISDLMYGRRLGRDSDDWKKWCISVRE